MRAMLRSNPQESALLRRFIDFDAVRNCTHPSSPRLPNLRCPLMADPISALGAIGILSNFMQIADFTAGVVTKTREVLKSGSDAFRENIEIERLARECGWLGEWIQETSKKQQPLEQDETAVLAAARQCVLESERLLDMLKGLKLSETSRGIRRTFQGAHRAVRAVRKREDVAAHQKMLDSLNGQLAVALVQVLRYVNAQGNMIGPYRLNPWYRRKQVGFHEEVLNNMESHASHSLSTILNSKVEILETLRRQEANSLSTMQSQQSMLSRLCASADVVERDATDFHLHKWTSKCNAMVQSLTFPGMQLRKDAIASTYQTTFEWIFSSRHKFIDWLKHEGGIFWVSGKAGSGKSTLMKFISNHATTRSMLKTWAAPAEVHNLEFYFWYAGCELQKSHEGLLRGILHNIFEKLPQLLPKVVPHRWNKLESIEDIRTDSWSRTELSQALQEITALGSLGHRFCLFLDGLDEYSGEHHELLADLRTLASNACIKICVSSRPWNVFVNAFGSLDTVVHLEELTADDIYQYASGHLTKDDGCHPPAEIDKIVRDIVLKSQGVFFWVFLVTRSLERGLNEGDSIKILQRRLAEMPSDLVMFFKAMLERLDKFYHSETSQVLKLAAISLARRRGDLNNWLNFWLVRELDFADLEFAINMTHRLCNSDEITQMMKDTKAFINASCRDFLSVSASGQDVDFLHRTVYDFLSTTMVQNLLDTQVPPIFKNPRILLHIRLARCKILKIVPSREQPPEPTIFCFGADEPLDTIGSTQDPNYSGYVFDGSQELARAFGTAMGVLLCHCDHVMNRCPIVKDCQEIYRFLAANGEYAAVLQATKTHFPGDYTQLIAAAEQSPLLLLPPASPSSTSGLTAGQFVAELEKHKALQSLTSYEELKQVCRTHW